MTSHPDNSDHRGNPGRSHRADHPDHTTGDPDVTILGAGITGSMLAAVLARHGLRTLVLAEGEQPRNEPGEATLPCTSFLYELIAARYRLPEAALLADAGRVRGAVSHESGVQRTWGFAGHRPGEEHRHFQSLQFNVPSEHGESQFYRPDLDAWMLAAAVRRGARVRQRVRVDKAVAEDGCVRLVLESGEEIRTGFVVDTQGPDSAVARALGAECITGGTGTGTRVAGVHAVGVRPYDEVSPPLAGSHPWSQGTLHHVFDGGWLQVGHFRNAAGPLPMTALTTVTLSLDARRNPVRPGTDRDPWAEIVRHAARFPSVAAQLAGAQPVSQWSDDAPHWHASRAVGERMLLLDRAALGADPVLGRDLYTSAQLVLVAAGDLLAAARDGDWSAGRFRYLERLQLGMARRQDRFVAAAVTASGSFGLWSALLRVWLLGTMFDALALKRSLKELNAGGGETATAALRSDPDTGACHETLPEYLDLLDFTLASCRQAAGGTRTHRQAADEIFVRIRKERIVPPIYGFGDPADLDYVLSLRDRLRTLRWVRGQALPGVRRLVQPYGVRGGGKNLGHDE